MANAHKGNTFFVDTTGTLFPGPVTVNSVLVKSAAAIARIILRDGGSGGDIKLDFGNVPIDTADGVSGLRKMFKADIHATISGAGAVAFIDVE